MAGGVIDGSGLDRLIASLAGAGYATIGPTVRDDVIVYDVVTSVADLPQGWTDRQAPGEYRIERRRDSRRFGYVVGPHSWKRFLYPPRTVIWAGSRSPNGWQDAPPAESPRYAFIGVRGCELAAMRIQDRVFMAEGRPADRTYAERRRAAFIVAVDCIEPGATCFCMSMGTGPTAGTDGYDLALTELDDDRYFVVAGSREGEELLAEIGAHPPTDEDVTRRAAVARAAEAGVSKRFDAGDVPDLLLSNLEHHHWERVGERCLGCANCTLVCPTCFCSTMEDGSSLDGVRAERTRRWDSCFTLDFSYLHGGSLRADRGARYRQWLTHKLATWIEQFGTSGCVGCGRCITWCPVGIDLTAEVEAIRASDMRLGAPIRLVGVRA